MSDIVLCTINAKWIHPSLGLRLLKANLGEYEARTEIIEFALRQPLAEKTETLLRARPRILGVSVSMASSFRRIPAILRKALASNRCTDSFQATPRMALWKVLYRLSVSATRKKSSWGLSFSVRFCSLRAFRRL
jgi:hypothetical protein